MRSDDDPSQPTRDVAATFLRWSTTRAVFHRGWWLLTSLYLVVEAGLTASELLVYGAVLALTTVVAEVPTGVIADTISRKRSLVIAHIVMGTGMTLMGFVTNFELILVPQVLWALGWTFSSGADIAWVTDELNRPDRISRLLITRARLEQVGAASGLVGFGLLGWWIGLGPAIVIAGVGMLLLGAVVALTFTEHNFTPTHEDRWRTSLAIFRGGLALARRDREILTVLAAWFLVQSAAEVGFLVPKRLVELGLPENPAPIVWLTALGLVTLAVGALALRAVEQRIDGVGAARSFYVVACMVGAIGLMVVAAAPEEFTAAAGVLLVEGMAWPVARSVSEVWVNRRATSDVRATVQSMLAQMESFGEITAGIGLAIVAQSVGLPALFSAAAALAALAGLLVLRSHAGRAS